MLVVKVELWSAVDGRKETLAQMVIYNDGTSADPKKGNYDCATLRGRSESALLKALRGRKYTRFGRVENYARLSQHVWNLVARALSTMKYGG